MRKPFVLPVAEYAPDLPSGTASGNILNVYPRTPLSYGPVSAPAAQYNALTSRCQGGAAYKDSSGNVHIFAGDANNLYVARAGTGATWLNVSRSPNSYTTGAEMWRFAYFNGDVIATNFGDPPQRLTLIGGTAFADLDGGPPRAKSIAVVKNAFVVLANTYDTTNGNMPQRVRWSAAGNHRSWPSPGTTEAAQLQSGAVDLLGDGGSAQGMAAGLVSADAVVFQQYAVRRMQYTGPPSVFTFLPVESAVGCLCPDSIIVYGGIAYYWSQDGIRAFDGANSRPIGANKVDKTIYSNLDGGNVSRVVGAADPVNQLIWWAYPSSQAINGNPNRLLCYSPVLDRFTESEVTCETLLRLLSVGYTLDELYTIFGYTLDTVPAPLDSEVWQGGRLTLGLFDANHKINFLTGAPLAATVETQEMEPHTARQTFIDSCTPMVDGATPSVAIGKRNRKKDAVEYTDPVAMNELGECGVRACGMYVRAKITVPAGSTDWSHISGVKIPLVARGRR